MILKLCFQAPGMLLLCKLAYMAENFFLLVLQYLILIDSLEGAGV